MGKVVGLINVQKIEHIRPNIHMFRIRHERDRNPVFEFGHQQRFDKLYRSGAQLVDPACGGAVYVIVHRARQIEHEGHFNSADTLNSRGIRNGCQRFKVVFTVVGVKDIVQVAHKEGIKFITTLHRHLAPLIAFFNNWRAIHAVCQA